VVVGSYWALVFLITLGSAMFPVTGRASLTVLPAATSTAEFVVTRIRTFDAALLGMFVVTFSALYAVSLLRTITGQAGVITPGTDTSVGVRLLIFVVALLSDWGTVRCAGLARTNHMGLTPTQGRHIQMYLNSLNSPSVPTLCHISPMR
jgi:hypothetical protein